MKALITGAAGFIGSNFVHQHLKNFSEICVVDKLTYAGNLENLAPLIELNKIYFHQVDICHASKMAEIINQFQPDVLVHFAAESHVDNSILGPRAFIETNIIGTFTLLEECRKYLTSSKNKNFKFIHISTDEVFGSLGPAGHFTESSPYQPNSPYSASKAGSDHLTRAWYHTYQFPVITTNCSNNYGPRQNSEKLIPLMIKNALLEKPLPVYGNGSNIRDWIHVKDHCAGIYLAITKGEIGQTYCFGGNCEMNNLEIVHKICHLLQEKKEPKTVAHYKDLISFVADRPGHDFRYAIDSSKAETQLGFQRQYKNLEAGLSELIIHSIG